MLRIAANNGEPPPSFPRGEGVFCFFFKLFASPLLRIAASNGLPPPLPSLGDETTGAFDEDFFFRLFEPPFLRIAASKGLPPPPPPLPNGLVFFALLGGVRLLGLDFAMCSFFFFSSIN